MDDDSYDMNGAQRDAEFSERLKDSVVRSAERAGLARCGRGRTAKRPMYMGDLKWLETSGIEVRRWYQ